MPKMKTRRAAAKRARAASGTQGCQFPPRESSARTAVAEGVSLSGSAAG